MSTIILTPPEGLVELPLEGDRTQRRTVADRLAVRLHEATGAEVREFASLAVAAGDEVLPQGVRLLGQFVVDTPSGPALGTLVVGSRELAAPEQVDDAFAERAIEALVAQTQERRPLADTRRVSTPAGAAVASLIYGDFRLPPDDTVVPSYRAEVLVPSPGWDRIVVLDVSTTSTDGWWAIATAGVHVARSLRFDPSVPLSTNERRLRL